jgi:hypothetical protein
MRNVSDKSCGGNLNIHFVFNNFFFRKSYHLWDNVEKYCRAVHGTQYGACALHAGDLRLQIHTQMCNTYCFSTATMILQKRLNVALYVHCLSCQNC